MTGARFVVLTQARTGSEYLCTRLNSHPQIVCHRELFNERRVVHVLPMRQFPELDDPSGRDADPIGFLGRILGATAELHPDQRCIGFKLFFDHHEAVREHVLSNREWSILWLERRNKLAQFTSLLIARETARWNARRGDPPIRHQVAVDLAEFAAYVESQAAASTATQRLLESRGGFLKIDSERIDASLPEMLSFLGVRPDEPTRSGRVRQNVPQMSERIVNWPNVASYLQRCGREDWASAEGDQGERCDAESRRSTSALASRALIRSGTSTAVIGTEPGGATLDNRDA